MATKSHGTPQHDVTATSDDEIAEFVRRSRAAQHLGPTVDDERALELIAALLIVDSNQRTKQSAGSKSGNRAPERSPNQGQNLLHGERADTLTEPGDAQRGLESKA